MLAKLEKTRKVDPVLRDGRHAAFAARAEGLREARRRAAETAKARAAAPTPPAAKPAAKPPGLPPRAKPPR